MCTFPLQDFHNAHIKQLRARTRKTSSSSIKSPMLTRSWHRSINSASARGRSLKSNLPRHCRAEFNDSFADAIFQSSEKRLARARPHFLLIQRLSNCSRERVSLSRSAPAKLTGVTLLLRSASIGYTRARYAHKRRG